jgi:hypothetical protein
MGQGDILMSMGEAKRLHQRTGQKVLIVGRDNRPIKSDLFHGVPYILNQPTGDRSPYLRLLNGPGVRPYIAGKTVERWRWRRYTPIPADLVFTLAELEFAAPFYGGVMVEPHVKPQAHRNKAWLSTYWQQLVLKDKKIPWVQCGPSGTRWLQGVKPAGTSTFREALAVMSVCRAFVGTEGGLHHGAAAVGVPAVVLWSEFISPEITGYATHMNLRRAGNPCGMRSECESCRQSMLTIGPEEVLTALKKVLE